MSLNPFKSKSSADGKKSDPKVESKAPENEADSTTSASPQPPAENVTPPDAKPPVESESKPPVESESKAPESPSAPVAEAKKSAKPAAKKKARKKPKDVKGQMSKTLKDFEAAVIDGKDFDSKHHDAATVIRIALKTGVPDILPTKVLDAFIAVRAVIKALKK